MFVQASTDTKSRDTKSRGSAYIDARAGGHGKQPVQLAQSSPDTSALGFLAR